MITSSRVVVKQVRQVVCRETKRVLVKARHAVVTVQPYACHPASYTTQGYNEFQYSLPRWEDLSLSRAGMYDDLYMHLPTQGWMFTPLVQYHSG